MLTYCDVIDTSSIQEPTTSNCEVTMTDCSRVVAMDAFLAQWNRKFITAQWSIQNTSCFNFFVHFYLFNFVTPCVSTRGIASIVNWTHRNTLQWNCNQNSYIIFQQNPSENVVWKMAAIFSQSQWVNLDNSQLTPSIGLLLMPWLSVLSNGTHIIQASICYQWTNKGTYIWLMAFFPWA